MTRFDELLRRGLMDANLAQFEWVLQQADGAEPDFSPRYLRERTRMLADPWGWVRRRSRGKRLDWRLIAIVAALLLLSACAYAVVTGQFAQWFPRLGVDPAAPEVSENVMSRTGTVIEQSQTVGDATVTLNAGLWDGKYVYLSLSVESPRIPEEVAQYTPLYTAECHLKLREDQWEEDVRKRGESASVELPPDQLEEVIQAELNLGQTGHDFGFDVLGREGNVLAFQLTKPLFTPIDRPEFTLHLENIAVYADGKGESGLDENGFAVNPGPGEIFLEGPFDFTFTLGEPILPIRYGGAAVEAAPMDVPLRFTGFKVSSTELTAYFDVLAPVDLPGPGWTPNPDKLNFRDIALAAPDAVRGLWMSDGIYVDLTGMGANGGSDSAGRRYPYPIDPAEITALDIAGTRVELSELEVLAE